MRRKVEVAKGHGLLVVAVVWFGVLAVLALADVRLQTVQLLATGFLFLCGAALHARSPIRMLVNGVGGGVVGLVLVQLVGIVRAFVTGDAGVEGETPFSLLIESPIWTAFLSPLAAGIGLVGAATRYWVELILRDRAAKAS
jgi:hypothetical protein